MSIAWHAIRDHLTDSSSKLHFQRSFDAIRRTQAALAAFRDPAALLDGLHRTPGDPARKNLILSVLVGAAQGVGPASDCALTVLLLLYFTNREIIDLFGVELFASEGVRTFASAIGLVLSVPITTGIAALTVSPARIPQNTPRRVDPFDPLPT